MVAKRNFSKKLYWLIMIPLTAISATLAIFGTVAVVHDQLIAYEDLACLDKYKKVRKIDRAEWEWQITQNCDVKVQYDYFPTSKVVVSPRLWLGRESQWSANNNQKYLMLAWSPAVLGLLIFLYRRNLLRSGKMSREKKTVKKF